MSAFFGWLSSLLPRRPLPRDHGAPPAPAAPDPLEHARALAREGRLQEASEAYWKIKRKHLTVDGLLEHAELLFELGDFFGAASMAARARDVEPDNGRAQAIQGRVRASEERERTRP